jgi:hypothetical protein
MWQDPGTLDKRAIDAAEVGQDQSLRGATDLDVVSTDMRVLEREVVIWRATNREQVESKGNGTDNVPFELDDQETIR